MRINRESIIAIATAAALLLTCGAGRRAGATELQAASPSQTPPVSGPAAGAANPADVGSIDTILHAVYETISGPAGRQRDWNRFRSLFVSGARLIAVLPKPEGGFWAVVVSPEEYVQHSAPYFQKNGFFEREVARRTDHFANMAQVFSTYESRHDVADTKPFERGINSFQLMNDGQRWWIVTIFWQGENPESPLPDKYLHGVIP